MVNAPANNGQNWDELVSKTKKTLFQKLINNLILN
jgi:hypothetical protein